jgi:hypothetical protein
MKLVSKLSMFLVAVGVLVCGISIVLAHQVSPHIELPWQLALLLYWAAIVAISGFARWLGAPRWLAFAIPIAPIAAWLIYSLVTGAWIVGEGGGVPMWPVVILYLVLALPPSAITVFIVSKRHDKTRA